MPVAAGRDKPLCAASGVIAAFDWWAIAERLSRIVGEPLVDRQLTAPRS